MSVSNSSLPAALVHAGLLAAERAESISRATSADASFIDLLLRDGVIGARTLALFCASHYGFAFEDLNALRPADLAPDLLDLLDRRLRERHRVLPLRRRGNRLTVAVSDPGDAEALAQARFQCALSIEAVVAEHPLLLQLLGVPMAGGAATGMESDNGIAAPSGAAMRAAPPPALAIVRGKGDGDDTPAVGFLHEVLHKAVRLRASDLHFEPFEHFYRIRARVDGVLIDLAQPPLAMKDSLASRIKVLARLDIAEKRVPQDGRLRLKLDDAGGGNPRERGTAAGEISVDFRVSTLPTLFGEKIVLRLLNNSAAESDIAALGFDDAQRALLLAALARPQGMILMTGPTGSGKTVSLYACLHLLNRPERNIATIEDPVEINLAGVNQVNLNERAGLDFATALRAFLRQDPDVIMVGEIRDADTADIAVKAAQTGHMVLSTLHTGDAPSTLTRLLNMGVEAFNIASSVTLIVAQRLARRLCRCKKVVMLPDAVLVEAGCPPAMRALPWQAHTATGCDTCAGSGYRGRIGLYQVMPVSAAIEALILAHATAPQIAAQAAGEGVATLRQAGLEKVRLGLTSLEEVLACTPA